jgi:thioredoxin reductase (NADPH)
LYLSIIYYKDYSMNRISSIFALLVVLTGVSWYGYKTYHKRISPETLSITKKIHQASYGSTTSPITIDLNNALNKERIIPVAIIGSGPAGLSAALYTARAALYTVVFLGPTPGGQLTTTTYVENWPGTKKMLGTELIEQTKKQAESFGALMVNDSISSVDFSQWPFKLTTDEGHEVYALSVIIATGATPRKLNVPGEKEYFGGGVTTCAICDAPFYKGKKVVVVGGGDSAVEEGTLLTSYADHVTVLVRKSTMRAAPAMRKRLDIPGKITILYNVEITEVLGNGKAVTGIKLKNHTTNTISTMPIDGVFLAIGHEPNIHLFKQFLATDDLDYIYLATRTQETSVPGVVAAGDIADHRYRQAGVAAGDGVKAALDTVAFLQDHGFNEEFARNLESKYYDPYMATPAIKLQKIITNSDFDQLAKKPEPLIVKVGASYCPPCKTLMPLIESIAGQFEGRVQFAQIDLDDDPKELVKRFTIKEVPSLLIFKKGKLVSRHDKQMFTKRELHTLVNQVVQTK